MVANDDVGLRLMTGLPAELSGGYSARCYDDAVFPASHHQLILDEQQDDEESTDDEDDKTK